MSQHEIREIEVTIEAAREKVELGQMAERLALQPEFKKLVLDGYFVNEASRLALLSSDPMINEEIRGHVMRDLAGVGAFRRYMSTMVQMGRQAQREIEECGSTIEAIRQEDAEDFE